MTHVRLTAIAAICLLLATAATAKEEFYTSLLERGVADARSGRLDPAVQELRIAAFGLLDDPPLYEKAQIYLAVVHARLGKKDDARVAATKAAQAERLAPSYAQLDLDPATRAEFVRLAPAMLSSAMLASAPAFSGKASPPPVLPKAPESRNPAAAQYPPPAEVPQIAAQQSTPVSQPAEPAPAQARAVAPPPAEPKPAEPKPAEPQTVAPPPAMRATTATSAPQDPPKAGKAPQVATTATPVKSVSSTPTPIVAPPQPAVAIVRPAPGSTPAPQKSAEVARVVAAPPTTKSVPAKPQQTAETRPPSTPNARVAPAAIVLPEPSSPKPQALSTAKSPGGESGSLESNGGGSNVNPLVAAARRTPSSSVGALSIDARLDEAGRLLEEGHSIAARNAYVEISSTPGFSRSEALTAARGLTLASAWRESANLYNRVLPFRAGEEIHMFSAAVDNFELGYPAAARKLLEAALPLLPHTPEIESYRTKIEQAR